MGRLSQQAELDLMQSQINMVGSGVDAFTKAAMLIGTEGLWIGLQLNLFLVSGEVDERNEVIFTQRKALNSLFEKGGLIDILKHNFEIPGLSFLGDTAKIPNPISPIAKFISPIGIPLTNFHWEEHQVPAKPVIGFLPQPENAEMINKRVKVYDAVPVPLRVMLTLMLPGLLRLVLKFLGDILDLG